MQHLSSKPRSNIESSSSGEVGEFTINLEDNGYKSLIQKANSVNLSDVFRHYSFVVDPSNRKICCPFPSHKGGNESTPSLLYYPDTNSFWCFGCQKGRFATDFVSSIDQISKTSAANKILQLFQSDYVPIEQDSVNKLSYLLLFSEVVREFNQNFTSSKDREFIENICKTYDRLYAKYDLTTDALELIANQLKDKILNYE